MEKGGTAESGAFEKSALTRNGSKAGMLLIGDLSGIQDYLFDVANSGGGQARRMRARSLYIQLIAECALRRILDSCGWDERALVFCGAGKFILLPDCSVADVEARVREEAAVISDLLLTELGGRLRFSVSLRDTGSNIRTDYLAVQRDLQFSKGRGWSDIVCSSQDWNTGRLRLKPLDTPCQICLKRAREKDDNGRIFSIRVETDNGEERWEVCRLCFEDFEIGRRMPDRPHIFIGDSKINGGDSFRILGKFVTFSRVQNPPEPSAVRIQRRVARHVPTERVEEDGARFIAPVDFRKIAELSKGDSLLGVLKADVDSMGNVFTSLLEQAADLFPMQALSRRLDGFFAGTLNDQLAKDLSENEFKNIYTIFSGGDDLLLVGPWNVILDFAGHIRTLFQKEFGAEGLTFSAGVAFIGPKRPIKFAVEDAEHLLELAKAQPGKNHVAALGQVWDWTDHEHILFQGRQMAERIDKKLMPRGWAQTLLRFALKRDVGTAAERLSVTSKLSYHIARNYPPIFDEFRRRRPPSPNERLQSELRRWADDVLEDFDDQVHGVSKFLPAITRYALMATRKPDGQKNGKDKGE